MTRAASSDEEEDAQAGMPERDTATLPFGLERGPVAVAVLIGSLLVAGLIGRTPWWVAPTVVVVLVTTVTVKVGGRTMPRRLQDWASYRNGFATRARARAALPGVRDVEVPAGICGIREVGATMVAMIQLAPNLDLPTVIAENSTYTEDTVPISALVGMLDQYGVALDIDILTTGQRVRPTGSYGMLYDQLIGSHPVVGNRMTWLVVRLDQERNLEVLSRRGPCAVVGPKALATAAHRIAVLLRERGIAAHVLPADYMGDATRLLHAGVALTDLREAWDCLLTPALGRTVTSYWVDPARMNSEALDECWAWNSDHTTLAVSLTKQAAQADPAKAEMRALVRYIGPPVDSPPFSQLRSLTGHQSEALMASLPAATTIAGLGVWSAWVDAATAAELKIPIGPSGQILGTISGRPRHTLALPLFDPSRYHPRRRTIDVQAKLAVAQQIVLRAAVVGADVEIHTNRPQRWQQLVSEVNDPRSLRLVTSPSEAGTSAATMAVFDNVAPTATNAHTTITITEPGSSTRSSANLAISQVSATAVNVSIPMHTVRVDLIEPVGETRYFDSADTPGPPPVVAPPTSGPVPGATPDQARHATYPVSPPIGR